ncbi:host attachment protein [Albidovulum sp.]|uniref:host attachment protein n=1 Tax=Albidovulum sp. TaxID=1872424 RepID=UPI0039B95747
MKTDRTLVLMADDAEARFLLNDGPGTGLKEHACLMADQFPDLQIDYQDRAGRHTGAGSPRHGIDPRETLEQQRRERFARHVVEALAQEWGQVRAGRLVVAAAPKMLGILRKQLSGAPAAALAGDIAKDLMKIPAIDLPKHFEGLVKL